MGKVFVSHSSKDFERTMEIVGILEREGIQCWVSERDIPLGEDFAAVIFDAMQACSCVLLIGSEHSQESQHVAREITLSQNLGKRLIAVKIEDVEFTGAHAYYLNSSNWTTAYKGTPEEMIRIVSEIGQIIHEDCPHTAETEEKAPRKTVNKVMCPICKSEKLIERDSFEMLCSLSNGFRIVSSWAVWLFMFLETALLIPAFLLSDPVKGEAILEVILRIPYLGDFVASSKNAQIGMYVVVSINLLFWGLLIMVATGFEMLRARYYRMQIQKGSAAIKCECKDCGYEFTAEYSAEELRKRNAKAPKTVRDVAVAILLILGMAAMVYCADVLLLLIVLGLVTIPLVAVLVTVQVCARYYLEKKKNDAEEQEPLKTVLRKEFQSLIHDITKKKGNKNYDQPC